MGLSQLRLVQPTHFPNTEATARASGADDVLHQAQLFSDYSSSLQDCQLVFGTSARKRTLTWPTLTPRECAERALATPHQKVAIVFGREHSGLTNQELEQCHFLIQIPTVPHFSSLNLASAVQILAYELQLVQQLPSSPPTLSTPQDTVASVEELQRFYAHLEQTLIEIDYFDPKKPKLLKRRLQRLFNRTQLLNSEVSLLRGMLTAIQATLRNKP